MDGKRSTGVIMAAVVPEVLVQYSNVLDPALDKVIIGVVAVAAAAEMDSLTVVNLIMEMTVMNNLQLLPLITPLADALKVISITASLQNNLKVFH
jgi:H+/Cl- antiporter ClcA